MYAILVLVHKWHLYLYRSQKKAQRCPWCLCSCVWNEWAVNKIDGWKSLESYAAGSRNRREEESTGAAVWRKMFWIMISFMQQFAQPQYSHVLQPSLNTPKPFQITKYNQSSHTSQLFPLNYSTPPPNNYAPTFLFIISLFVIKLNLITSNYSLW